MQRTGVIENDRHCVTRAPSCKAPLDYLQRIGVIENDRHCVRLTACWGEATHGCKVTISKAEVGKPVGEIEIIEKDV
jgi:hypothetical protein